MTIPMVKLETRRGGDDVAAADAQATPQWSLYHPTPWGDVSVSRGVAGVELRGVGLPTGHVEAPDPVGLVAARRGLRGSIDGVPLCLQRPHFTVRLKGRASYLKCGSLWLRCQPESYRSYVVVDERTASQVLTLAGKEAQIATDVSSEVAIAAILIFHSGIAESASLINALTI